MTTWRQYARLLFQIEEKYYPKILKALRAYVAAFAADLEQNGLSAANSTLTQQTFNDALLPIIQDLYKRVGLWGAKLQFRELKDAAKKHQKAGGFGRNEQWIAEVLAYLTRYGLEFVQNISDTTRNDILRILEQGTTANLSIEQIVYSLRTTGIVETRARAITRTELVRAANVGHQVGARSFPYEVNKKWVDAKDHRERSSHRLIGGHTIGEDDLFNVPVYKGDKPTGQIDQMNAPGDPTASASNTINCRCRVIYEPKTDAKGNLIPRPQKPTAIVVPMRRPQQTPLEQIAAALKASIRIEVKK